MLTHAGESVALPRVKTGGIDFNPELVRSVYAYAAYRLGDGPDAEDVTSETFERALRYQARYDRRKGEPIQWLIGIARRAADAALNRREQFSGDWSEEASEADLEAQVVERVRLRQAIARLDDRSRDLIALRYGADLSGRQLAVVLGVERNAASVALHRAVTRLRTELDG